METGPRRWRNVRNQIDILRHLTNARQTIKLSLIRTDSTMQIRFTTDTIAYLVSSGKRWGFVVKIIANGERKLVRVLRVYFLKLVFSMTSGGKERGYFKRETKTKT